MPSWNYEGERYILHTSRIKCLKCETIVEGSGYCKCKSIYVDRERVVGDLNIQQPLSIWRTETKPYKYLPQEVIQAAFNKMKDTALVG